MTKANVNQTLAEAKYMYKRAFKVAFVLTVLLAFLSEYFVVYMMNSGAMVALQVYNETGVMPENIPGASTLLWLSVAVILGTMVIYGLIICILGASRRAESVAIYKSTAMLAIGFDLLKGRFFSLLGVYIICALIWSALVMFLSVIGMWLAITFLLVAIPAVLLGGKNVFQGIAMSFKLAKDSIFYTFQIALMVVAMILIKPLLYVILPSLGIESSVGFGLEHVIIIFIDACVKPFMLALVVAAYYELMRQHQAIYG